MSKCIICGKEVDKTYGNSNLMGVYCRRCATENHYTNEQLIEDLQSKLAEKNKEIEKLKTILTMQAVQASEEQRLSLINTNCIQYNQNQIAVEQLEKVKETINDKYQYLSKLEQQGELTYYGEGAQSLCYLLLKQIEQQIKQLKEMK